MINFNKALVKLLSDVQESSPNLKNTLNEISPIAFSVRLKGHNLKGHKKLYFYINNKNSSISFSEIFPSQFNINASMIDIIQTFSSGKLKKNLIDGDTELAIVFFNAIIKSNIDFIYLIDKYFGNIPALFTYTILNKIFNTEEIYADSQYRDIRKKLRDISIRIDRLEAYSNL